MANTSQTMQLLDTTGRKLDLVTMSKRCDKGAGGECMNNTISMNAYISDFGQEIEKCITVNNRISDINEVINTTSYIGDIQQQKMDQMEDVLGNMMNQTLIAQQNYRLNDYHMNETNFYRSFLIYGIFVINIILILGALFIIEKLPKNIFIGVVCGLVGLFTIAFAIRIKENADRRKTDWSKLRMGILAETNSGSTGNLLV
jgi:hypothetical protein